ncbi:hypothetical protein TeGR_g10257 [Tetraparma gracilis]|uniref:Uncharacterized protein n=1 Tax=Tetraparma gracilis TaxID=2962635 RepID=A0ABQ6N1A1_9STRA|nr:hypothetical protein TeGR_g10257 [Tetraparma gracilis]
MRLLNFGKNNKENASLAPPSSLNPLPSLSPPSSSSDTPPDNMNNRKPALSESTSANQPQQAAPASERQKEYIRMLQERNR